MRTTFTAAIFGLGLVANAQQPTASQKALEDLLTSYLGIKDALMADSGNAAAASAAYLLVALDKVDPASLAPVEAKVFNSAYGKMKMNAEHIRENATKVDHQREHFDFLGDKVYVVVKGIRFPHAAIFYFYSAQGNGGESAHWLSDRDELKSPYASGHIRPTDKRLEEIPVEQ